MIKIEKLAFLPENQRRRKIILCLDTIEKSIQAADCSVIGSKEISDTGFYLNEILRLVLSDSKLSGEERADIVSLKNQLQDISGVLSGDESAASVASGVGLLRRVVNNTRHHLLRITGVLPAEWDLIVPERIKSGSFIPETAFVGGKPGRFYFPGPWGSRSCLGDSNCKVF